MKKQAVEKVISTLPLPKISTSVWWNLAISLGGILLIMFAFREALKSLGLIESKEDKREREKLEKNTLQLLASQGIYPNYNDFQYKQWADQAHEGMKYSNLSDDDDAVLEAAKFMNNDVDVVRWAAAYGKRQLHYFGVNDGPIKTLFQAMATDLKSKTKSAINENWSSKGISMRV